MSVSRLTATGVQVLDAGGTPNARLSGIGVQVLDAGGTPSARLSGIGAQVLALDPDFLPLPGVFRLAWEDDGIGKDGYRLYYSPAPMDPQALPAPVATLAATATAVDWTNAAVWAGDAGYFRVGAYRGDDEVVSAEQLLKAEPHYRPFAAAWRATVSVALVADDTGHAATTNTRQALLDAGFLDANISVASDDAAPPAADIVLVCRACATQAETDNVLTAFAAGTPVVWGPASLTAGTGRSMGPTFARLTGTLTAASNGDGYNGDELRVRDQHIPRAFSPVPRQVALFTGANWGWSLDSGAAFVGTRLADGDPDVAALAGNATLLAIEAGTEDLDGNPTPARSVVWTNLYGGQTSYTEDGRELLARCIEWCLGYA